MRHILLLKNPIQKYVWGSRTAIPELCGKVPSGDPQAEIWMGAHPKAPSAAKIGGTWVPLPQLIEKNPESILGKRSAKRFHNQLPFLFKVLAAEMPLSIQAHPDAKQAKMGFSKETEAGVPLSSETRNYRDVNHKPECICALTPFSALNGFRAIGGIRFYIEKLCPNELGNELASLSDHPNPQGLKQFFGALMMKPKDKVCLILEEALEVAKRQGGDDPVYSWIIRLLVTYPMDIGALAPALLNLIVLKPGEALYLSSGRLHAYLDGVGMELMANSDNVLRGGLTPKHIDVSELMKVLRFEETRPEILRPVQEAPGIRRYHTPAEEFALSEITVDGLIRFKNRENAGAEILFCLEGTATVSEVFDTSELTLSKGMSIFVPASVKEYTLEGKAVFYRASVGGI